MIDVTPHPALRSSAYFPDCNRVLNLFISSPQDVQQTGKFASGTPRCRLLSLVFVHNRTYERLFGPGFESRF
jgi:hypothetical protein